MAIGDKVRKYQEQKAQRLAQEQTTRKVNRAKMPLEPGRPGPLGFFSHRMHDELVAEVDAQVAELRAIYQPGVLLNIQLRMWRDAEIARRMFARRVAGGSHPAIKTLHKLTNQAETALRKVMAQPLRTAPLEPEPDAEDPVLAAYRRSREDTEIRDQTPREAEGQTQAPEPGPSPAGLPESEAQAGGQAGPSPGVGHGLDPSK